MALCICGCGAADEKETDVIIKPSGVPTPSTAPASRTDAPATPAPKGERIRVAITLEMPSFAAAGFRSGDDSPEAAAYREKLAEEQRRVIDAIREVTGEEPDVAQQLWRNVNVISANVRESDIPLIEGIEGVAGVTREKRSQPMSSPSGAGK